MQRRDLLRWFGAAALANSLHAEATCPAEKPDYTLRIAAMTVEPVPGKKIKTIGYNGSAPGPMLRVPEGKEVTVDVVNDTKTPEMVHWHGLPIPSEVDGAMEEGTPMIPPG